MPLCCLTASDDILSPRPNGGTGRRAGFLVQNLVNNWSKTTILGLSSHLDTPAKSLIIQKPDFIPRDYESTVLTVELRALRLGSLGGSLKSCAFLIVRRVGCARPDGSAALAAAAS